MSSKDLIICVKQSQHVQNERWCFTYEDNKCIKINRLDNSILNRAYCSCSHDISLFDYLPSTDKSFKTNGYEFTFMYEFDNGFKELIVYNSINNKLVGVIKRNNIANNYTRWDIICQFNSI